MCVKRRRDAIIPLKDHGRTVSLLNADRASLDVTVVDGCAVKDGERCDYMVSMATTGDELYVELKGADVGKAVAQIVRTTDLLSKVDRTRRRALILSSRYPRADTALQNAIVRAKKHCVDSLLVRTGTRFEAPVSFLFGA